MNFNILKLVRAAFQKTPQTVNVKEVVETDDPAKTHDMADDLEQWIDLMFLCIRTLEPSMTVFFRFHQIDRLRDAVIHCYQSNSGNYMCNDKEFGSIVVQGLKTWNKVWPMIEEHAEIMAEQIKMDELDRRLFVTATPKNTREEIRPEHRPFLVRILIAQTKFARSNLLREQLERVVRGSDKDAHDHCGCEEHGCCDCGH
ncbi:MAG: hypothetical protein WC477_02965 [Patescibacteria group bacterium]